MSRGFGNGTCNEMSNTVQRKASIPSSCRQCRGYCLPSRKSPATLALQPKVNSMEITVLYTAYTCFLVWLIHAWYRGEIALYKDRKYILSFVCGLKVVLCPFPGSAPQPDEPCSETFCNLSYSNLRCAHTDTRAAGIPAATSMRGLLRVFFDDLHHRSQWLLSGHIT